jgi:hypothetical protein
MTPTSLYAASWRVHPRRRSRDSLSRCSHRSGEAKARPVARLQRHWSAEKHSWTRLPLIASCLVIACSGGGAGLRQAAGAGATDVSLPPKAVEEACARAVPSTSVPVLCPTTWPNHQPAGYGGSEVDQPGARRLFAERVQWPRRVSAACVPSLSGRRGRPVRRPLAHDLTGAARENTHGGNPRAGRLNVHTRVAGEPDRARDDRA